MKIAPCPNPKCDHRCSPVAVDPEGPEGPGFVKCLACGLRGPDGQPVSAAIAAWNSISMGWRKPETAPKDGNIFICHWPGDDDESYCDFQYWEPMFNRWHDSPFDDGRMFDYWHPIPPLPEPK